MATETKQKKLTINLLDDKYYEILKNKLKDISKVSSLKETKFNNILQKYIFNLPEYNIDKRVLFSKMIIHFDLDKIDKIKKILNNEKINPKTTYIYYPEKRKIYYKDVSYYSDIKLENKYPIYIISKGRYDTRYTSKILEDLKVDYKIVVEKQECDKYAEFISRDKILILPKKYLNEKSTGGSIPARKFVWDHAKKSGFDKHWILDDNIKNFYRLNLSKKIPLKTGNFFRILEEFMDCFQNMGQLGMMESKFVPGIEHFKRKIYTLNTRCFSTILINTKLCEEHGVNNWRGVYNEDSDLSIRILKAGLTTACFNQFLQDKPTTLSVKGGNTDSIYKGKGLVKKVESLIKQHPDCVKKTYRFSKPHFLINYKSFKNNKLILIKNPPQNKFNEDVYKFLLK